MICENANALDAKMLPQQTSRTIFINPNFKQTHINPNFLKIRAPNHIHVNPNFFQSPNIAGAPVPSQPQLGYQGKIITKTRTKLVRERATIAKKPVARPPTMQTQSPLVKIGKRGLIRASLVVNKEKPKILPQSKAIKKSYKIDRRIKRQSSTKSPLKRKCFISRYALIRSIVSEALMPRQVVVRSRKMLKIGSSKVYTNGKNFQNPPQPEGKVRLVNINGVLYKLNKNKMHKANDFKKTSNPGVSGRTIFVRGDRFVLDKSGKSLTRVQNPENMKLQRIDIGGMTYLEKSPNVFVRTNVHKVRNHLSSAKQKSINILSRNLVKTNIPCPIFRKVGKCAAFERGKCPKVHDKKQVTICQKFLKGECTIKNCLLSHEVSLSKMPTCKFFLQGCCVRDECPYLHKKVNEKTEICIEFQRGFCLLAEKCNKRHDFERPNKDVDNKTLKTKSVKETKKIVNQVRLDRKIEKCNSENSKTENTSESAKEKTTSRYFGGDEKRETDNKDRIENEHSTNSEEALENIEVEDDTKNYLNKRPKLGELPAFIPL